MERAAHAEVGASPDSESGIDLKPDQYMLVDAEPDLDAARRWHVANRIRRSDVGSQKRLLHYFTENVGKVLTTEELAYVAKEAKQYARRVRELRTEHGCFVATRFTGRPDLNVGQYVLKSKERVAEPHDCKIPDRFKRQYINATTTLVAFVFGTMTVGRPTTPASSNFTILSTTKTAAKTPRAISSSFAASVTMRFMPANTPRRSTRSGSRYDRCVHRTKTNRHHAGDSRQGH